MIIKKREITINGTMKSTEVYDETGKIVKSSNKYGDFNYTYDANDNIIKLQTCNLTGYIKEYNKDGFETHSKTERGVEAWTEYNENNEIISYKDYTGKKYNVTYIYDTNFIVSKTIYEDGNCETRTFIKSDKGLLMVRYQNSQGTIHVKDYDNMGRMILERDCSKNSTRYFEYNEHGRIHSSCDESGSTEYWMDYDESGNMTHYRASNGHDFKNEYDEHGNITKRTDNYNTVWEYKYEYYNEGS